MASSTADTSNNNDEVEGAADPEASGDKTTNSAATPNGADFTHAHQTTKIVPVAEPGEPCKDPAPAPLSSDTPPPPPPRKSTPAPQEAPVIPSKEGESESPKATDANEAGVIDRVDHSAGLYMVPCIGN